uniref:Nonstructural polyprotein n=1 Tax=Dongbei arctic lamprey hepevirus TaxID=2116396 RepID=A0A2P1GMP7_9VIRU|nr:nonstructural polyprotein [Dongbei arctic lamprey hepevirus]
MDLSLRAVSDNALRGAIDAVILERDAAALRNRSRSAFEAPYVLEDGERALVLRDLRVDVNFTGRVRNTHGLLRTFHKYAQDEAERHQTDVLDIGGDPRELFRRAGHTCLLVDNPRDELRVARFRADQRKAKGGYCTEGSENCSHPATHAICVHAAYDITAEQWARIFETHGLQTVDVWIIEEPKMHLGADFRSTYGYDVKFRGDHVDMLMHDGTNGYTHRRKEWLKYAKAAYFPANGFNICISPEATVGPLRRYTLYRAHTGGVTRNYVHDVAAHVLTLPSLTGGERLHIPAEKFNKIITWGVTRTDTSFHFTGLAAYARALKSSLKIGKACVNTHWEVDAAELHDLCITMYVYCAVLRHTRTRTLSRAMKRLQHEQNRGCLRYIWDAIVQACGGQTFNGTDGMRLLRKDLSMMVAAQSDPDIIKRKVPPSGGQRFGWTLPFEDDETDGVTTNGDRADIMTYDEDLMERWIGTWDLAFDQHDGVSPKSRPKEESSDSEDDDQPSDDLSSPPSAPIAGASAPPLPDTEQTPPAPDAPAIVPTAPPLFPRVDDVPEFRAALDYWNCSLRVTELGNSKYATVANQAIKTEHALDGGQLTLHLGPPGCGKSRSFKVGDTDVQKKATLVVVPTRKQKQEWESAGYLARTSVAAMALLPDYKRVIVDEFTLVHPGALVVCASREECHFLGDMNQIGHIDFDRTGFNFDLRIFLNHGAVLTSNVTHRCPQDVAKFISPLYPGITSSSTVKRSVTFSKEVPFGVPVLTFTQHSKEKMRRRGHNVTTVHEAQGMTYSQVALYVSVADETLIRTSRSHNVVALTRHKEKLIVIEERTMIISSAWTHAEGIQAIATGDSTPMFSTEVPMEPTLRVHFAEEPCIVSEPSPAANFDDVPFVFGCGDGIHAVLPSSAPAPASASLVVSTDTGFVGEHQATSMNLDGAPACRITYGDDDYAAVMANATRYARLQIIATPRVVHQRSAQLLEGLRTWLVDDADDLLRPLDSLDEFALRFSEYMRAMHEKNPRTVERNTADDVDWSDITCVKNHIKQQCKYAGDALAKVKVGQGINAWSKQANTAIGPFVRFAESTLERLLAPGVMMVLHQNTDEISEHVRQHWRDDDERLATDFTEFDSTQNEITAHYELRVLRMCGVKNEILDLYKALRSNYRISGKSGLVQGQWMRHSGEPNTLLGNTLVTMGVIGACYEIRGDLCAMFKGDDSYVAAERVTSLMSMDEIAETYGMITKEERPEVPEFVSFFLTHEGVVPNLRRLLAKVSEKNMDPQLMDEYREAVRSDLAILQCARKRIACFAANELALGMSPDRVAVVYDMLHSFSCGRGVPSLQPRQVMVTDV